MAQVTFKEEEEGEKGSLGLWQLRGGDLGEERGLLNQGEHLSAWVEGLPD